MESPIVGSVESAFSSKKRIKQARKASLIASKIAQTEGISVTDTPTPLIMVCNAGASTNTKEHLLLTFQEFGPVTYVTFVHKKPYCFIEYLDVESAEAAYNQVYGRDFPVGPLTKSLSLAFVNCIPEDKASPKLTIDRLINSGLLLLKNYLSEEEGTGFMDNIEFDVKIEDTLKFRQVKHYGYRFFYETKSVDLENPLVENIPAVCLRLLERLLSDGFISCIPDQLTVNQYKPGQGIPPHIDAHSAFNDEIVIVSLGSGVLMDFSKDKETVEVYLEPLSVLIMTDEARYAWEHKIAIREADILKTSKGLRAFRRDIRTSFTFRSARKYGLCCCQFPEYCDSRKKTNCAVTHPKPDFSDFLSESQAQKFENIHVHQVYEKISDHFSETRYRPWPKVSEFLSNLEPNAAVLDVGCGNGKYLGSHACQFQIGCDYNMRLVEICAERKVESLRCDAMHLPFRDSSFDVVISIALLHHISTKERRLSIIREILRVLLPGGKLLVYAWAKIQRKNSQPSTYLKEDIHAKTNHDLEFLKCELGNGESVELPLHKNRCEFARKDMFVPWTLSKAASHNCTTGGDRVCHRYCHLFVESELEAYFAQVGGFSLINSYYDEGNWCVLYEKCNGKNL